MENLKEYLIKLGIYDSEKTERFKFFINILKEWNSFMNLTAIKDDEGIEIKHIIDSLTLLETDCISKDKKVLDVGSGAGFPSVPIKISIPELKMDLCQPFGFDTTKVPISAARIHPSTQNASKITTTRPRIARGENHRDRKSVV